MPSQAEFYRVHMAERLEERIAWRNKCTESLYHVEPWMERMRDEVRAVAD